MRMLNVWSTSPKQASEKASEKASNECAHLAEVSVDDLGLGCHLKQHRKCKTILGAHERAELFGEHLGEHIEPPIH